MNAQSEYMLLVHGPNLNRLGQRDPGTYGTQTLLDVTQSVEEAASKFGVRVESLQSNHEGELIDFLQARGPNAIGIIINPGAFGHYSYALRDCLDDIGTRTVEVHLSNVHRREPFRHNLVLAAVVSGQIVGLGFIGYKFAAEALCTSWLQKKNEKTL